jgi:glutathione peroxidase
MSTNNTKGHSVESIYEFKLPDITGKERSLSEFKGKVLVIVNVASKCGYTNSNYDQLGKLLDKHYDDGFRVLMFPCNQFGSQEPGNREQINEFACARNPRFEMFDKINVNGSDTHPLYEYLKKTCPGFITNAVKWNFTKFLVDRNGVPVKRFGPNEEPMSFADKIGELLGNPSK